ncbi:MAG: UDP-N-acetylmuramoyl-L-alanine--D-glutamate ligase [Rhodospirillales bacterium]|nr:UDP-N-acetylmuramoyl-L-alanine--D-glutamate ligase [Rhodospirillales bacterium]
MITVSAFKDRKIGVLGLGRSGLVAARALAAGGARVMAWDDAAATRDKAAAAGVAIVDLATADLAGMAALVLSPGIPHTHPAPHPVVVRAREAGAEIIGDIELLARTQREAAMVGITGTNGKSTTTSLIAHIVGSAGRQVAVGGNLGTPALSLAPLGSDGIYVLEMSSYQLELTQSLAFDAAILLNVTPDHLGRHGGMDGYIAAKRRIFRGQARSQAAIVGVDDAICRGIHEDLACACDRIVVPISAERRVPGGIYVADGILTDDTKGTAAPVIEMAGLARLPGIHNWQNAAAAYAAVRHLGIAAGVAAEAIRSFPGLAHRQELIATIDGVRYVNDSKATNADAAAKALACYETVYWIAGGLAKEGGIASLAPYFGRIRHAFLIGDSATAFADTLGGAVHHRRSGELAAAVSAARETALAEGAKDAVVLLSPACASFDQFSDFEARGDAFRSLVEALPGRRT